MRHPRWLKLYASPLFTPLSHVDPALFLGDDTIPVGTPGRDLQQDWGRGRFPGCVPNESCWPRHQSSYSTITRDSEKRKI